MFWFSNATFFRIPATLPFTTEELRTALGQRPFTHCGTAQKLSRGWDTPFEDDDLHVREAMGCELFCYRKQEKIPNPKTVKALFKKQLLARERESDRKLAREEKANLKDTIILGLLNKPGTRIKDVSVRGYFDRQNRWLILDTVSESSIKEVLKFLHQSLSPFEVTPLRFRTSPEVIMTRWLHNAATPEGFTLLGNCKLREIDPKGARASFLREDLYGDEVGAHLNGGKIVSQLAVRWNDRLMLALDESGVVVRIKPEPRILEEIYENDPETNLAFQDLAYTVMVSEFRELVISLIEVYEGEAGIA